jgi:hypothetical protein
MPVEVFYSYAHEDETLRVELEKHLSALERQKLIDGWHDRRISAGQQWKDAIDAHVSSAEIILLLVSPDFLASDYCYEIEMATALRRHRERTAVVVPIILRAVDWTGTPFAHLQALPRDGKPVTSWLNRDEAFLEIAQGIREIVSRTPSPAQDAHPEPRGREQAHQQRVLDAAMPGRVVKGQTTELQTLIRLPESPGLKGILQADDDAEPRPEDVVSKAFPVTFPRDLSGALAEFTAQVTLSGPDFTFPAHTKRFVVPPDRDSEVVTFLLIPQRTGKLRVLVELQWQDAVRGTRRLLTECVAEASASAGPPPLHLVQIPLEESGESARTTDDTLFKMRHTEGRTRAESTEFAAASPSPVDDDEAAAPRPPAHHSRSRAAWIGASGTLAAVLIAGVYLGLPRSDVPQVTFPSVGTPVQTPQARVIWEKNWQTINEPRPQMGSSTGSWTAKAQMLDTLNALELSTAPELAQKRDELISLVKQADTNPNDPNYDVRYTPQIRAAETELKRAIRNRALEHGAAVRSP